MAMFWEFFTFELKFRFKSISTYVYFLLWFAFSFSASPSRALVRSATANGKILLNGPYANIYNDIGASFFGVIVIAAIFGTSILRDFQRDTIRSCSPSRSRSSPTSAAAGPDRSSPPSSLSPA